MASTVAEILAHSAGRVRCDVLHGGRLGGRSRDDNRVIHGPEIAKRLHHLCDRRTLLPNGAVNTDQVLAFAVDDGVESNGGLAGLTVANYQLALSTANRNH